MTKINYFKIQQDDYTFMQNYFTKQLNKNKVFSILDHGLKNKMKSKEIIIQNSKDINKNRLIQIALGYLDYYKYDTDKLTYDKYHIELFQYRCIDFNKKIDNLSYHKDDYAILDYKVNTIIFYITKSNTLNGGNLLININNKKNIIPIEANMGLAFHGDLIHKPQPCSGLGLRECIVIQLARKK